MSFGHAVVVVAACQMLAGCAPQGSSPRRTALLATASPAPTGYGPAFRVTRAIRPLLGDERQASAAWNGKLILAAAADVQNGGWPGLWITDGTAAGTRCLRDRLVIRAGMYKGDSSFVPFAGALYFTAAEYDASNATVSGYELWRTDGTPEGTSQVVELNPGSASAWPRELTAARGGLYFVAGTGGVGYGSQLGLYRTDGTAAGTKLVERIDGTNFDVNGPQLGLTAVGGELFFRHPAPSGGQELHKLAPCPGALQLECATLVRDLGPASQGSYGSLPRMLVALGDQLIFAADGVDGRSIYRSDGTAAGTSLLARANYLGPTNGERLSIAAGGYAYLLQYGTGLWRTDGTPEGTLLLAEGHGAWQYWMTSALGTVYFWGADPSTGWDPWINAERWRTDGTVAGTHVLKDICPGSCSSWSYGAPPLALEPEGRLFFSATSGGAAGLWTSDGTEAGTTLLEDFRGITDDRATAPLGLVRAGDLVYFSLPIPGPYTGTTGLYDEELWAVRIDLADRTPPDLACPAAILAEASGPSGARVDFTVAGRDNLTPDVPVSLTQPPGWFPLGDTVVEASATDAAGSTGLCRFKVEVRDTTPPSLACPADIVTEAAAADGASVAFAVAAIDAVSPAAVTSSFPSGATFPLGSTAVTATATDAAGNSASCAFTVTVRDGRAPLLACPPDQVLEASSPEGSAGDWPDATALDLVSAVAVTYAPARGALLAQGSHAVVATGADAAGNLATCGFTVVVSDTTAPVVTCPADVTATAATANGLPVAFPAPTAIDTGTPAPAVELDHASGSLFPVGITTVQATSRDSAGNVGSCSFRVEIVAVDDPPPPAPTLSGSGCSTGQAGLGSLLALLGLLRRRGRAAGQAVRPPA